MFLGVNLSAQNKNPESAVRHLSHFNSTTGLVTNKNVIAISTANIAWLNGTPAGRFSQLKPTDMGAKIPASTPQVLCKSADRNVKRQ